MDKLYQIAEEHGIRIYERNLRGNIKGLYIDGNIALKKGLTEFERRCVVAEEIAHQKFTVGDITDQSKVENRKQERFARGKCYMDLIPPDLIVQALLAKCTTEDEFLEYLQVTKEFFIEAINYYKQKYGICYSCKDYTLYFEPLSVVGAYSNLGGEHI